MSKGITYHIITIVAVFTALGIGILVGSMLNGEQLVMRYQTSLMSELGEHIKLLKSENSELKLRVEELIEEINVREAMINDNEQGVGSGE